jgi:hypothetical protein
MMPSALAVFGLMAGPMRSGLMSLLGQNRKSSTRANVFRFAPRRRKKISRAKEFSLRVAYRVAHVADFHEHPKFPGQRV